MAPGCLKQTQGDRIPENPEFVTARTESGSSSTGGEERKGEKEALRSGAQSSVGERRGRHARALLLAEAHWAAVAGLAGVASGPGEEEEARGRASRAAAWFPGAPPLFFLFIFFSVFLFQSIFPNIILCTNK